MRRFFKWLIIILVVLIVLGGGWYWWQTQQSSDTKQAPKVEPVKIVSVGDSLTQGIGYANDHQGYLPILKQQITQQYYVKPTTQNFGVGGERSDQIDRRVTHNTKLRLALKHADVVAVTAGGNDLLQSLEKNVMVNSDKKLEANMAPLKTTYQQKLTKLIADIHAVNPKAEVYLFGIYNPVYVYFTNASMITSAVNEWNAVNRQVAQSASKTDFINVNKLLSNGQYRTANDRASLKQQSRQNDKNYVDPLKVEKLLQDQSSKEKNAYLSSHDHFHPNKKGYTLMAKQLLKTMGPNESWQQR